MKIDSFNIDQQAMSKYHRVEKQEISIEIQQFRVEDALDISEQIKSLTSVDEEPEDYLTEEDKRKIELLEQFISWLSGKEFKFKSVYMKNGKQKKAHKNKGNAGNQIGIRIHTKHEVYESERMKFKSSGTVKTADGRSIEFDYNLSMSRETYEKNEMMLQAGNFQDPLVLDLDTTGVDFGDKKIQIDLDLDGDLDDISFLSRGSGFLALDKNNNKQIDDGTELFGPETGHGFAELAAYDLDGNQWIDENDEIFNSLKIWTLDADGKAELIGLKDADVGAIYLGAVASQYTIKHGDEDMAKIKGSSIYLKENGEANVIHEMDFKI